MSEATGLLPLAPASARPPVPGRFEGSAPPGGHRNGPGRWGCAPARRPAYGALGMHQHLPLPSQPSFLPQSVLRPNFLQSSDCDPPVQ